MSADDRYHGRRRISFLPPDKLRENLRFLWTNGGILVLIGAVIVAVSLGDSEFGAALVVVGLTAIVVGIPIALRLWWVARRDDHEVGESPDD